MSQNANVAGSILKNIFSGWWEWKPQHLVLVSRNRV